MADSTTAPGATKRPNILLVVSDQERQRSWLPEGTSLPWRDRLRAEGLEFTDYFTHSSPCSPSRASSRTSDRLSRTTRSGAARSTASNSFWVVSPSSRSAA